MHPRPRRTKRWDDLTARDLKAFPIWRFADHLEGVEGWDSTWVCPVDMPTVPRGYWSLSVAADFRTASGRRLPGMVEVFTAGRTSVGNAVLLSRGRSAFVCADENVERDEVASELGLTVSAIFPLKFTLRVLIGREKKLRSGIYR